MMHHLKFYFSSYYSLLVPITVALSASGCLTDVNDELPPLEEEYSVDGGMYQPERPRETSGYGSGASGASGASSGSGASAGSGSGATKEAQGGDPHTPEADQEYDESSPESSPEASEESERDSRDEHASRDEQQQVDEAVPSIDRDHASPLELGDRLQRLQVGVSASMERYR